MCAFEIMAELCCFSYIIIISIYQISEFVTRSNSEYPWLLGTLSNENGDGDGDSKTCKKTGERTPLWWQFLVKQPFCTISTGPIILIFRTILILVLTSMVWKTTSAFQSFASTRTTYHFWLKYWGFLR